MLCNLEMSLYISKVGNTYLDPKTNVDFRKTFMADFNGSSVNLPGGIVFLYHVKLSCVTYEGPVEVL